MARSTKHHGVRIDYDDSGDADGPALLCLPGWCASRRAFDPLTPHLAPSHRVLALDWRGHGCSSPANGDFGFEAQVEDALAVIGASGATSIIPVATAHAGWVAIELRRRLGPLIPRLVLIDWIVTEAPPPFLAGLAAMQDPATFRPALDGLFASWLEGVHHEGVARFVRDDMATYPFEMWRRAGREITAAYARHGSPFAALRALDPPAPTLHLYAQPPAPAYLAVQRAFAESHPWFQVTHLDARSHFPTIEVPEAVGAAIRAFAR